MTRRRWARVGPATSSSRLVLDGTMPSLGAPSLTGPGFAVAKLSADNQTVRWRKKFSGSVAVRVGRVLVDEQDDVYVTGNVVTSQSAAIGTTTITGGHRFVAKLRGTDGELVWVHEVGATSSSAFGLATKPGRPIVLRRPTSRSTSVVSTWTTGGGSSLE